MSMTKEFNTTGVCIPERHYMVDTSRKLDVALELVQKGKYFAINRPRQYGKTTTLFLLEKRLLTTAEYLPLSISFEGIGQESFADAKLFITAFSNRIAGALAYLKADQLYDCLKSRMPELATWDDLSQIISMLTNLSHQKIVLIIDEVDKSSDNQLFLDFLGLLRNKYLLRSTGKDSTFHSVILAGVHDVKTLKLKLRPEDERKYNSPWNIAADFNVDLSFSATEIATMLADYQNERKVAFSLAELAERLYFYTSGHPFLVSRICEIIDTRIDAADKWSEAGIVSAVKLLLGEDNTNFSSLIKNIENAPALYEFLQRIIIDGETIPYVGTDTLIARAALHGIIREADGICAIHNQVYALLLYDHMMSKKLTQAGKTGISDYNFRDNFIDADRLDMAKILVKFQQFMREQYSVKGGKFLEREGRLILLAFIKPIINGQGFDFKEVQISEEKRLDIVITFANRKYVLELKRWAGEAAHRRGLQQLADYLERQGLDRGYLVVFDFSQAREERWSEDRTTVDGKEIMMVRV
jgi:hypothetical protein